MKTLLPALFAAFFLAACATKPPAVYKAESFSAVTPFQHDFALSTSLACESGRRALLSQGYQVADSTFEKIEGTKAFQSATGQHTIISITLVCLPTASGSSIYANARQTHFVLKANNTSAGISVAGLGSLSLPWAASNDTLVRVGEETVTDGEFYERFFSLVESFM